MYPAQQHSIDFQQALRPEALYLDQFTGRSILSDNLPKSTVFERLRIWEGHRKLLPPTTKGVWPTNTIR